MSLEKTDELSFPFIPHVNPIWPKNKRPAKMKTRKTSHWRLVRNRMIVLRFLRSLHPEMPADLLPNVVEKDENGSNISELTKIFHNEQRQKFKRLQEIQMEAYIRAESQKNVWEKLRERKCTFERKTTRDHHFIDSNFHLPNENRKTPGEDRAKTKLDSAVRFNAEFREGHIRNKDRRTKFEARSFIDLKEEHCLSRRTDQTCSLPQINHKSCERTKLNASRDPRFQRLLNSLIPPQDKTTKSGISKTPILPVTFNTENKEGTRNGTQPWQR
ncbi:uncharacterized protein LOC114965509 [Acropora millepora]|uniref:uncharacterized protein LOC114965509 n=1 Tax=Acropora millepora TaxID=45264 RepID=UPI001CF30B48|nr:uncharacterized protein LOC114965509 [Acropora millepora]